MRMDVTIEEFGALGFKNWRMCKGWEPEYLGPNDEYHLDYDGEPLPEDKVCVTIRHIKHEDASEKDLSFRITFAMMQAVSELFQTKNVNLTTGYDPGFSDMTPGGGYIVVMRVRGVD